KAQFAQLTVQREQAKAAKEEIIAQAQELADSTEWGRTAGAFRDLMARWKAAGSAGRDEDDRLWEVFHGLQDTFFQARQAAQSAQDSEFGANLSAKLALLDEAEAAILPVSDINEAKNAFRSFLESYNAIGRVPREQMRSLDARVRTLENAVRNAEEDEWRRTDPTARARAEETVSMLTAEIEKLTAKIAKAEAKGDQAAADKAKESVKTYESWLKQAQETLDEFTS
ncbi:MAG: DUF349 domain-containing protein, partial [Propionibacteriaceae bacterium]|nr:DUF349 domain-containing protein [Propionibacteriaceae bacterium]